MIGAAGSSRGARIVERRSEVECDELKRRVCDAIDHHRDEIIGLGREIREHAELGFKEERSAAAAAKRFAAHGIPYETGLALTGVKAVLTGLEPAPTVGILGELDSLVCADSPYADKTTGAAHT